MTLLKAEETQEHTDKDYQSHMMRRRDEVGVGKITSSSEQHRRLISQANIYPSFAPSVMNCWYKYMT